MQESQWVFIKHGLPSASLGHRPSAVGERSRTTVGERSRTALGHQILEVGFGTGLNALLAMRWAEEHQVEVHFTTLETNVLSIELAEQLNYASSEQERFVFLKMHAAVWNQDVVITPHFTLHKAQREVQSEASEAQFDVIFFDAFGPPTQPEMWTPDVFQRMFNALKPEGILVTYCAKGQVRRDMQSVGFTVERLPGPPGKREMMRATKPANHG
jgi:tRNA U34 5-methylaminomethyl-2-thiouridine-forming methyltransferase MnmC